MAQILNDEFINELKEMDPDLLPQLMDLFQTNSATKIVELRTASENKNWEILRKTAHALRSSSLNLGAVAFPEVLHKIEYFAEGSEASVPELVTEAEKSLEAFKTEFQRFLK